MLELNNIYNGDCLELMKGIPDGSIDMVLCDLPYGTTQNKWDSVIPLDKIWVHYERIIKDNGAIVLFAQTPFDKLLGVSNLKLLKYEWIWVKQKGTGHLNAKKMPLKNHENILVFYKKIPTYNPQFSEGKPYDKGEQNVKSSNYGLQKGARYVNEDGKRYPKSVLNFNTVERGVHPTQKPVPLLEYLINTYTNENEVVLDNCIGSGSTIIACLNTNRQYIGIELDYDYYNIAKNRIELHKESINT